MSNFKTFAPTTRMRTIEKINSILGKDMKGVTIEKDDFGNIIEATWDVTKYKHDFKIYFSFEDSRLVYLNMVAIDDSIYMLEGYLYHYLRKDLDVGSYIDEATRKEFKLD